MEKLLSSLQDTIFWYFLNYQKLVRVRSASMTNKTPSGRVVCRYCHNPGHVSRNYRKLQNKNQRFQSVHEPKSLLSLHLLLSLHSSSQVKPTHVFFPLPPLRALTL